MNHSGSSETVNRSNHFHKEERCEPCVHGFAASEEVGHLDDTPAQQKQEYDQCNLIHCQGIIHLPQSQLQSFTEWREAQMDLTAMTPTVSHGPFLSWRKRSCEIEFIFSCFIIWFSILIPCSIRGAFLKSYSYSNPRCLTVLTPAGCSICKSVLHWHCKLGGRVFATYAFCFWGHDSDHVMNVNVNPVLIQFYFLFWFVTILWLSGQFQSFVCLFLAKKPLENVAVNTNWPTAGWETKINAA